MKTIKINVKTYSLRTDQPEYIELAKKLRERGLNHFEVWHDNKRDRRIEPGEYTVETDHLFDNQTNTAEGWRVFDWYDGMPNIGNKIRIGHYIEDNAGFRALQELRRNTNRCGYCGHQESAARGLVFHLDCLGSEYLAPKDLKLTRMVCIADHNPDFPELTEAEKGYLLPLYKEAQLHGNNERSRKRIEKQREDIKRKFEKETENARLEYEGFTWLMDHGINTNNAIYYSHTGKFCFGWRNPISSEIEADLLAELEGFPFPYELKRGK